MKVLKNAFVKSLVQFPMSERKHAKRQGKSLLQLVEYNPELKKFVNVSPKDMEAKKSCDPAACAKMTKEECAAKCAKVKAVGKTKAGAEKMKSKNVARAKAVKSGT